MPHQVTKSVACFNRIHNVLNSIRTINYVSTEQNFLFKFYAVRITALSHIAFTLNLCKVGATTTYLAQM